MDLCVRLSAPIDPFSKMINPQVCMNRCGYSNDCYYPNDSLCDQGCYKAKHTYLT